jgi:hypothetical protein
MCHADSGRRLEGMIAKLQTSGRHIGKSVLRQRHQKAAHVANRVASGVALTPASSTPNQQDDGSSFRTPEVSPAKPAGNIGGKPVSPSESSGASLLQTASPPSDHVAVTMESPDHPSLQRDSRWRTIALKATAAAATVGTLEPSNLSVRILPHWQVKGDCNEVGVKNIHHVCVLTFPKVA